MMDIIPGIACLLVMGAVVFVLPFMELRWWWKRKFQLHLSTLLIIVIIASVLMAMNANVFKLNFTVYSTSYYKDRKALKPSEVLGWPIVALAPAAWKKYSGPDDPDIDFFFCMAANLIIGLNVLSLSAMALEKFAERKR